MRVSNSGVPPPKAEYTVSGKLTSCQVPVLKLRTLNRFKPSDFSWATA